MNTEGTARETNYYMYLLYAIHYTYTAHACDRWYLIIRWIKLISSRRLYLLALFIYTTAYASAMQNARVKQNISSGIASYVHPDHLFF